MTPQELLANIPLFESLTDDDVDALASRLESVDYDAGDVIFNQGDEGSALFVIEDGAVEVSRNVLEEAEERLTFGQRIADKVASFGGSWPFIIIFGAVMTVWMGVNIAGAAHFDPYPFILLNLALSTVAAIQAPIIMMSQNRQASKDKLLAENDYQVNLKAEMEIESMLRNQTELMARLALIERLIVRRAGADVFDT